VPKEGGELGTRPDGGADVAMRCEECESASEMALVLSPEEAEPSACTRWESARKRPDVLRRYGSAVR
jgi:hypothetical protein